ncbi:MAG: PPC domain-containing protein [Acidobacteriota bacterium]|nr:PPC domain-containing protein [Acidobacteriota bacterium]
MKLFVLSALALCLAPAMSQDSFRDGETHFGLSGKANSWTYYKLEVQEGVEELRITVSGGSGDVDLYTAQGFLPTADSYDCRPFEEGSNETCVIPYPERGVYYIGLSAFSAFSEVVVDVDGAVATPVGDGDVTPIDAEPVETEPDPCDEELERAVNDNFEVSGGPPPSLSPRGGQSMHQAMRNLNARMEALGCESASGTVGGVPIVWGSGRASSNKDGAIVIATGNSRGGSADARANGNGSSAYADGGDGFGDQKGGNANANAQDGNANSTGGDSFNGNGGNATSTAGGNGNNATANGGNSNNGGQGGKGTATSNGSNGSSNAKGGNGGTGGTGSATSNGANGTATATGGNSSNGGVTGGAGNATAGGSGGTATANGGTGGSNTQGNPGGQGGPATAVAGAGGTATANGGTGGNSPTNPGAGGTASATAPGGTATENPGSPGQKK